MNEGMAPAGWYPVDEKNLRYWDGQQWTDHFHERPGPANEFSAGEAGGGTAASSRASSAAKRLIDTHQDLPEGTVWSAVGRPVTGIGAGRYRMDAHYLYFEKGTLRTDSQQVPIANVLDVDVKQSLTQKARGVYTVYVHIQRPNRVEVVAMEDIPDGRTAQQQINAAAHSARSLILRNQNTMRYEGQPPSVLTSQAPATEAAREHNPLEQLKELAKLRDAGVLTDEEFQSKKAEILARI
ncbi:MAG TPA: DUF2510 domain-containing protein [Nocardioidaceae bacterium]|nr:DUF2510 domain-containing protein [Nocardioidaceae bacterium]HET7414096.1 DUF2510 domain-containing protein [Arthrobacter sp.]